MTHLLTGVKCRATSVAKKIVTWLRWICVCLLFKIFVKWLRCAFLKFVMCVCLLFINFVTWLRCASVQHAGRNVINLFPIREPPIAAMPSLHMINNSIILKKTFFHDHEHQKSFSIPSKAKIWRCLEGTAKKSFYKKNLFRWNTLVYIHVIT